MKTTVRIFILTLFTSAILGNSFFLQAQSVESGRRIEENKRSALRATQAVPSSVSVIAVDEAALSEEEYFRILVESKYIFFRDLCRALTILLGSDTQYDTLSSQIAFLKEARIFLPSDVQEISDSMPLEKGFVAVAFCKSLGLRGGLWMRICGVTERYAVKELIFKGMMMQGHPRDVMSGRELIYVLTQAANFFVDMQQPKVAVPVNER